MTASELIKRLERFDGNLELTVEFQDQEGERGHTAEGGYCPTDVQEVAREDGSKALLLQIATL